MSDTDKPTTRRQQLATTIPEPTRKQIQWLIKRGYTKTQIATLGVDKLFREQLEQVKVMEGKG